MLPLTSPLRSNGHRALVVLGLIAIGGLAACSSDGGDPAAVETAAGDGDSTADKEPDAALGEGLTGEGTLTITLDDGRVFPFAGDCDITVDDPQITYSFSLDAPEGELAGARHTVNQDIGEPTSVQFTDDDLRRYFVSSFSNTIVSGTDWSSDIVAESEIDGEPFTANGRVESTCS